MSNDVLSAGSCNMRTAMSVNLYSAVSDDIGMQCLMAYSPYCLMYSLQCLLTCDLHCLMTHGQQCSSH
jgi:hypothetical protein